ncbi:hypothetical protein JCM10213_006202 [Rhodosporidiobolus nylandii]
MPAQETGDCCVCGKATKDRCGACAEAGLDLFFCSRECQKLVWFAHKHVCGPGKAASPFLFPNLSPDEVAQAKRLASWSSPAGPEGLITISRFVQRLAGVSEEQVPLTLEAFSKAHLVQCFLGASDVGFLLVMIRAILRDKVQADSKASNDLSEAAHPQVIRMNEPLPTLSNFVARLAFGHHEDDSEPTGSSPTIVLPFPAHEPWWAAVVHQALVVAAVRYLLIKDALKQPRSRHEGAFKTSSRLLAQMTPMVQQHNSSMGRAFGEALKALEFMDLEEDERIRKQWDAEDAAWEAKWAEIGGEALA